jgi:hypothetical protein
VDGSVVTDNGTLPSLAGILGGIPSRNFANDAAAASGGVAIGQLYHNAGVVRVRLT